MSRAALAEALRSTEPVSPVDSIVAGLHIIEVTAVTFGVTTDAVLGGSRVRPLVDARHVAMAVVRAATPLSWSAIGRLFDRDHRTVMSGVERVIGDTQMRGWAAAVFGEIGSPIMGANTRSGDTLGATADASEPGDVRPPPALAPPTDRRDDDAR